MHAVGSRLARMCDWGHQPNDQGSPWVGQSGTACEQEEGQESMSLHFSASLGADDTNPNWAIGKNSSDKYCALIGL